MAPIGQMSLPGLISGILAVILPQWTIISRNRKNVLNILVIACLACIDNIKLWPVIVLCEWLQFTATPTLLMTLSIHFSVQKWNWSSLIIVSLSHLSNPWHVELSFLFRTSPSWHYRIVQHWREHLPEWDRLRPTVHQSQCTNGCSDLVFGPCLLIIIDLICTSIA